MHLTSLFDLLFTHDWNVVFSRTCYNTGIAAGTSAKVNCHTPLMTFVLVLVEERESFSFGKVSYF